jgi:hypothetical protein
MLARMLDRHSQIAVVMETGFFLPAFRARLETAESAGTHRALLDYLCAIGIDTGSGESIAARFALSPATAFDLFRCLLQDYAATHGKPRCGEKSPWHVLVVPRLLAAYPRAKVICLIRDGRDVVLSSSKFGGLMRQPKWYHAMSWCRSVGLAERFERQYSDRFLICRFERFVENPVAEALRLAEFVGISFEPEQLLGDPPNTRQHPSAWYQFSNDSEDRANGPPDKGRACAWRRASDTREIRYLTALMNPCLLRHGYDSYSSQRVGGQRSHYWAYRSAAYLLGLSQISSTLTNAVTWRSRRQRTT